RRDPARRRSPWSAQPFRSPWSCRGDSPPLSRCCVPRSLTKRGTCSESPPVILLRWRRVLDADVIVVGAGLAGLVATAELAAAGRRVMLLEQEPEPYLGGQAFWSFGGLFFVDSPEQRRLGIRDSHDLALQDWMGAAAF